MAGKTTTWFPEQKPRLEAALRQSRTRAEAAKRVGVSLPAFTYGCLTLGVDVRSNLDADREANRAPIAEPVVSPPSEPLGTMVPAPPEVDWKGARSTSVDFERRVILGDLHIPYHDLNACACALAIIRAVQPHTIVQLGDYYNMGAVSHHPRPFGGRENHSRSVVMGRAFADAVRRAAPAATLHVLLGNHDDWGIEYEDVNPQFAGMFSADKSLDAQRLSINVHGRHAQPLVLGPVAYKHGYGGGTHFCQRYALDDGPVVGVKEMVVAHHHTIQRFHAKNGVVCWGAGWLGEVGTGGAFDYAKNPRGWEKGLLIQDVYGDHVTTYPIQIRGRSALVFGRMVTA